MGERQILRRSVNTEHAVASHRPRLRGLSHRVAAVAAFPLAFAWIAAAPPGRPRAAVAAFSLGVAVMFACSALLHLRPWDAGRHERFLRLDHTGIYLAIGGTGAAVAMLGFEGTAQRVVFVGVVLGVIAGIVAEWLPFAAPRGFNNTVYLVIGWIPLVMIPWLWRASGPLVVALLLAGGAFYTAGAIIVGVRRPHLSRTWFGYHELFHVLVIAAVAMHAGMIAVLVERAR